MIHTILMVMLVLIWVAFALIALGIAINMFCSMSTVKRPPPRRQLAPPMSPTPEEVQENLERFRKSLKGGW